MVEATGHVSKVENQARLLMCSTSHGLAVRWATANMAEDFGAHEITQLHSKGNAFLSSPSFHLSMSYIVLSLRSQELGVIVGKIRMCC
jgi:hypothetical protein